tara:strand:- start:3433 stop:4173 length:741 start_codon:yes stop_codon:yes gene_type:complete
MKIDNIIQWCDGKGLEYSIGDNYNPTIAIDKPWNVWESKTHNISFITDGWIDNNAGVVFSNKTPPHKNFSLIIKSDNPKLSFLKCINKFFTPEPCNIKRGENVTVGKNCTIGGDGYQYLDDNGKLLKFPHFGGVVIEDDVDIANNVCIDRGALSDTIIKKGVKIDNLVHIAHNVIIGENSCVVAGAIICGSVVIGRGCWIAPGSCIKDQINIGDNVVIGLGCVVLKDVESNSVMVGNPAKLLRKKT